MTLELLANRQVRSSDWLGGIIPAKTVVTKAHGERDARDVEN